MHDKFKTLKTENTY